MGGSLDVDHGLAPNLRDTGGLRPKSSGALPFQSLLWRLPWLRSALLLIPPLGWFLIVYLASLALLLITAFWGIDPFTTKISSAVWLSFLAFLTLAANSLISTANLFSMA